MRELVRIIGEVKQHVCCADLTPKTFYTRLCNADKFNIIVINAGSVTFLDGSIMRLRVEDCCVYMPEHDLF